jgi:hypothetical protein
MTEACERARRLIGEDAVEGIAAAERGWLDGHLDECAGCAHFAESTAGAIRAVRMVAVQIPADLAFRTQFRVSLRAREAGRDRHSWALWLSFALSWAFGIACAPAVWRGFEWAGRSVGLPPVGVTLAFGLWWAAPAALAGAIWLWERKGLEED